MDANKCVAFTPNAGSRGLNQQIRTVIVLRRPAGQDGYRDYPDRGLGRHAGLLVGAHEKGEEYRAVLGACRGAHIRTGGVRVVYNEEDPALPPGSAGALRTAHCALRTRTRSSPFS